MKVIIIAIMLALSTSVQAQKEIKVEDAKNNVGDSVKICTKIFGGKFLETAKGTPTFLNAGGSYPAASYIYKYYK